MAPGAWSSASFNGGAMPRATPRRRRSTKQSSVEHSTPDETLQLQTKPANALITFDTDYAAETATHKTIEVSRRLIQLESQRNVDLIVGADNVVELHANNTKFTQELRFSCRMPQEFGNLDEATITAYIATGEPMDKAGCYGIQVLIPS
ncbi:hypothetical protein SELMODRAFT_405048 [Selaginella moellendorffii]|uniref:Uncharacterized protein n=1 Tax=Selaginella moellendorffii TaxID=88036 RepID=D8QY81_SELML|nr:hypothetical protein SELMODRAFT_405048 [Selaginella moellendorffii]